MLGDRDGHAHDRQWLFLDDLHSEAHMSQARERIREAEIKSLAWRHFVATTTSRHVYDALRSE